MKNMLFFILLCVLAINAGCNFNSLKNNGQKEAVNWSSLDIISEGSTKISINNDDDTSIVFVRPVFDFFTSSPKRKVKIDTLKVYLTKAEKDTIFNLSKEIISNPVKKFGCTEFVGDLKVIIEYGAFSQGRDPGSVRQSIEYTGVCNWNKLSPETMQLHEILKRKLKKVYLGEHEN